MTMKLDESLPCFPSEEGECTVKHIAVTEKSSGRTYVFDSDAKPFEKDGKTEYCIAVYENTMDFLAALWQFPMTGIQVPNHVFDYSDIIFQFADDGKIQVQSKDTNALVNVDILDLRAK